MSASWKAVPAGLIFAFSRVYEGKEVVVVLNFANTTRQEEMWVDAKISPAGTAFHDALNESYKTTAHSPVQNGSKLLVSVPPLSVRVLVRDAK